MSKVSAVYCKGFSLVEILVALMLASIIITCLLRSYISLKQQVINIQNNVQEQTELAWIVSLLRKTINQAGFTNCGNIKQLQSVDRHTNQSLIDVTWHNAHLELYHMAEPITRVNYVIDSKHLLLDHAVELNLDTILIADCHHAEVQSISSIYNKIITLSQPLAFNYHDPIYIGIWAKDVFFMKKNLALMHMSQQTEELSRLIQDLKVNRHNNLLDIELIDQHAQSTHVVAMVRA